jgi:hypothetical protein
MCECEPIMHVTASDCYHPPPNRNQRFRGGEIFFRAKSASSVIEERQGGRCEPGLVARNGPGPESIMAQSAIHISIEVGTRRPSTNCYCHRPIDYRAPCRLPTADCCQRSSQDFFLAPRSIGRTCARLSRTRTPARISPCQPQDSPPACLRWQQLAC